MTVHQRFRAQVHGRQTRFDSCFHHPAAVCTQRVIELIEPLLPHNQKRDNSEVVSRNVSKGVCVELIAKVTVNIQHMIIVLSIQVPPRHPSGISLHLLVLTAQPLKRCLTPSPFQPALLVRKRLLPPPGSLPTPRARGQASPLLPPCGRHSPNTLQAHQSKWMELPGCNQKNHRS